MSKRLDRLVAERVMGWKWVECGSTDYDGVMHNLRVLMPPQVATVDNLVASLAPRGGMSPDAFLGKFTPSSDISAAWEVKRAMYAKGFRLSLSEPFVSLIVSFKKGNDQGKPCGGSEQAQNEDKEPLAICLAALRACGVPEAEIQEAMTP